MKRMWSKNELNKIIFALVESGQVSIPYQEVGNITLANSWLNGLTAKNVYGKAVKQNNILFIVLSFQLVNETEADIQTPTASGIVNLFSIPETVADKIYRKDGSKVSGPVITGDDITALSMKLSNANGGIESRICNLYSTSANNLSIWASANTGAIEVSAGATLNVDLRFFLVL